MEMNNIVIVEDKLGRGISLAEQFAEFSQNNPNLKIEVRDICYFCPNTQKAQEDIRKRSESKFNIKPVTLLDFGRTMDEYISSQEERTFLIMDYMLDDDGSEGIPTRRVNIRYARNKNLCDTNQLWFYTATGTANENALSKLVGKEHVLDVVEVDENVLRLKLDNEDFMKVLSGFSNSEV